MIKRAHENFARPRVSRRARAARGRGAGGAAAGADGPPGAEGPVLAEAVFDGSAPGILERRADRQEPRRGPAQGLEGDFRRRGRPHAGPEVLRPSKKADHTQQLILTVPPKRAEALLKSWRRIGDLPAPAPNSTGERIPADEVRAKIDRLMKERVERAADLQKLPVALEIEDELLERLLMVEEVAKNQNGAVRIDLLVRQR